MTEGAEMAGLGGSIGSTGHAERAVHAGLEHAGVERAGVEHAGAVQGDAGRGERFDAVAAWPDVMMNNYGSPQVEIIHGTGATVTDADGREHIDLLAGIAVNSLGYGDTALIEAVAEQTRAFTHTSNLFAHAPGVRLAQRLRDRFAGVAEWAFVAQLRNQPQAAGEGREVSSAEELAAATRVFFCNSGAEANEAAFKLARLTGKRRILAAVNGFHGRTMGALAMTGQPGKRAPFEPVPSGVEFFPYGDIEYLRELVAVNPNDTAAIILEPIQGETGVIPAPEGFLAEVAQLCQQYDILFVVDEVQTGIGRTGFFFEHQRAGVVPDVVTLAKGLAGGLPIGAVIAGPKAARLFTPGSHGTTFGGNPVSAAAANVVLDRITPEFLENLQSTAEKFRESLAQLPGVSYVRGHGLMLGLVLEKPVAAQLAAAAPEHGLLLNAPAADVLRITPPLVIGEEELSEALRRLEKLLAEA